MNHQEPADYQPADRHKQVNRAVAIHLRRLAAERAKPKLRTAPDPMHSMDPHTGAHDRRDHLVDALERITTQHACGCFIGGQRCDGCDPQMAETTAFYLAQFESEEKSNFGMDNANDLA